MRNAIILFSCLIFAGLASGQAPEKRFVGNCSFSGFTLLADSTYRGNITRFDDRMGNGYNLTQLAVGYEIFDGRGLVFEIDTIHTSTNFTADVSVTAKVNRGFEPFGSGQVYNPTASGMVPPSSQEQAGLSPTQKARIDIHNVVKMEALVGGRDSVYSITNVPDTTTLSPVTGDIFINTAKDTAGFYDGAGWVLFFRGLRSNGLTLDFVGRYDGANGLVNADIEDDGTTVTIGFQGASEVDILPADTATIGGAVARLGGQAGNQITVDDDTGETDIVAVTGVDITATSPAQSITVSSTGVTATVNGVDFTARNPGGSVSSAVSDNATTKVILSRAYDDAFERQARMEIQAPADGSATTYVGIVAENDNTVDYSSFEVREAEAEANSTGLIRLAGDSLRVENYARSSGYGLPVSTPSTTMNDTTIMAWRGTGSAAVPLGFIPKPSGGGGAGDNLGDHTATQDLNMNGNTIIGGTGTTDDLTLQSTSGVGGTTSEIIFNVGNNGGTEAMRIRGNGNVGINQSTPAQTLHVSGTARITGSDGTPTGLMGRDADGDVGAVATEGGVDINTRGLFAPARVNNKPSLGMVLGNSTVAAYLGQSAVVDFLGVDNTLGDSIISIAVAGHTIAQQESAFLAHSRNTDVDYILIQLGLNNLDPGVWDSLTLIQEYSGLIDTIRSVNPSVVIFCATMTPAYSRLISVFGAQAGDAQDNWDDLNAAITEGYIKRVDYSVSKHTFLLGDSADRRILAAAYDTGDGIHENNAARAIIADQWRRALNEAGLLNVTGAEDGNGIYSGDGTTPTDLDITVTDNIDFDGGTLFLDGTNDRLGIGTTVPSVKVDVRGTIPSGTITPIARFEQLQTANGYGPSVVIKNNDASVYSISAIGFLNAAGTNTVTMGAAGSTYNNPTYPAIKANGSYFFSTGDFGMVAGAGKDFLFQIGTSGSPIKMALKSTGKVGIGTTTPTAMLHLPAGTATANTAPLKFTSGTNLTTPEAGAVEWDGTNLYVTQTSGPTRKTIAYTTDITANTNIANTNLTATGDRTVDWATYDLTFDFDSHALDEFAIQYNSPSGKVYGEHINDTDGYMFAYRQAVYTPAHLGDVVPRPLIAHNNTDMVTVGNSADSLTMQGEKLYMDIGNAGTDNAAVNRIATIDSSTDEVKILDLTPQSGPGAPGVAPRYNGDRYFDYTNSKWYSAWDNENGNGTGDGLDTEDWIILN